MESKPIIEQASEFVEDALDHAKEGLESLPRTARKRVGNLNRKTNAGAKRLADAVGPTWKAVQRQVRENPGIALGLGVLVGLLIGSLVRGRD
jgi:ElaB/YqjD/DUF883 family membrane-anchored ribosome-binding protein